jgi:hypothetical protein
MGASASSKEGFSLIPLLLNTPGTSPDQLQKRLGMINAYPCSWLVPAKHGTTEVGCHYSFLTYAIRWVRQAITRALQGK